VAKAQMKTISTKVMAELAPALHPHTVGLLRNRLGVLPARAMAGQLEALVMVSVEAPA